MNQILPAAQTALYWLSLFCMAFLVASGCIWLLQLMISYYRMRKYVRSLKYIDYKRFLDSEHMVPVSLIVPISQDDRFAEEALNNLLSLDFPEYEVIAVVYGEGSQMSQDMIDTFQLLPFQQPYKRSLHTGEIKMIYRSARDFRLIVLDKPNGCRADALNAGVNMSSYPIVVSVDANALFDHDALIKIVYSFVSDPTCVAVSGAARVLYEEAGLWIERRSLDLMQKTERLRALYTNRFGIFKAGAQLNIFDSFFAFKKTAVLEAGGYWLGIDGEEGDLLLQVQTLLRRGKRRFSVRFLPDPICSVVPLERMSEIRAQRHRWHNALAGALVRHRAMILSGQGGSSAGLLYFWFSDMLAPFIETLGYFLVLAAWLIGRVDLWFAVSYLMLSVLLGTALSAGAVLLEENAFQAKPDTGRMLWLVVFSLVENLGYRQITRACSIGRGNRAVQKKRF